MRGWDGRFLLLPAAFFCGCAPYRDFTLPKPDQPPREVNWRWEPRAEPVLGRGESWDSVDVLNPVVVKRGGLYYNFYSGFDGRAWHTGLATSSDGLHWEKRGKLLSPDSWEEDYIAANGSALVVDGEFRYWYQGGRVPRIGLAVSAGGRNWRKLAAPVLGTGPRGSWDERGVADPYVARFGNALYMFFLGQDRARRQRLGLAYSHDGVKWWKLRSNPILELGAPGAFDERGLGEPAVWASHGWYWMLYTGRDRNENRRLGLARSRDGARWEKLPAVYEGPAPWASKVICDPDVEFDGSAVRVWFGGGNKPAPAENLDGQIGVGMLRP